MQFAAVIASLFSVLVPAKMWVPTTQPIQIQIKSDTPVTLVLTDFSGRVLEGKSNPEFAPGSTAEIRAIFPSLNVPGAYVLWAVPRGKKYPEFTGTPLVLTARNDKRPGSPNPAEVQVTRIEPLQYGVITTDKGKITCAFFYDVAPNTVDTIERLAAEGFYDGLTFHRIVPGFVIQGGDPLGDGRGGPGFNTNAEFSDRKHVAGTLSMARTGDPLESQGFKPRAEFANSAGSQFFICLAPSTHLDNKYTDFGQVVDGMDAVNKIAAVPLEDRRTGKPKVAPVIEKFQILPVKPGENPYKSLMDANP